MTAYYEQAPPSPPFDDNAPTMAPSTLNAAGPQRCYLPPISSLIDVAGQGSPTQEMPRSKHLHDFATFASSRPSTRPHSQSGLPILHSGVLPPTPPMSNEASFSGYNSPNLKPASRNSIDHESPDNNNNSNNNTPSPAYGAPRMESQLSSTSSQYAQPPSYAAPSFRQPQWQQRYAAQPPPPMSRGIPYQPHASSGHPTSPADHQTPSSSNLYHQQPLPGVSSFASLPQSPRQTSQQPSPQLMGQLPLPPIQHHHQQQQPTHRQSPPPQPHQQHQQPHQPHQPHQQQPSPWQHHHYISPAMAAAFPLAQDRYVCATCSKAFSRPSSLRIHSHSHTGEKPFKCPHQGCGKAFSVRSNMKRHERGCHSYESAN